jgi:hypothetical protein
VSGVVHSINGKTGTLTIDGGPGVSVSTSSGSSVLIEVASELPSQAGNSGRVLASNGAAAGWYSLNAGVNVSITKNTSAQTIVVSATGGGGGGSGGVSIWPAIIFG